METKHNDKTQNENESNENGINENTAVLKKSNYSKRLHCEYCARKFNKEETYLKHMKQTHPENINTIDKISKSTDKSNQLLTPFQRIPRSNKKKGSALESIN